MKDRIQKILNFLSQDINLKHNYFILGGIFLLLTLVGYTSYALFTYEVYASSSINIVFRDNAGPKCNIVIPEDTVLGANETVSFTMNCTDSFDVIDKNLTSSDFTVNGQATITNVSKTQISRGYSYEITVVSGDVDDTVNISLNSNVLQDNNGNYNNTVTSNNFIIKLFPNEPTEYLLINTYTANETWIAPENGYYQIEVFGASGKGGGAKKACIYDYDTGKWICHHATGGGGGGGAYACSRVKMNAGDTISLIPAASGTTSSATVSSSIESYSVLSVTSGVNGGTGTAEADDYIHDVVAGTGGAGGTASGGNYANTNGGTGTDGVTGWSDKSSYTLTGGAGGTAAITGGNTGATGASTSTPMPAYTPGEVSYGETNGSSGFIKIYRGNTNLAG